MYLLKEGDKAPDFTLQADDGRMVSLSDFRGKKVVLYFYPKDNTLGCTREAVQFRDLKKEFDEYNTVILGVSKDSIKSHRRFKEKHGLSFPLLSDPEKEVHMKYGVWKEKKRYGRAFMGAERTTFIINGDGIIERVFSKVRVSGHGDEVLEEIKTCSLSM